MLDVLLAQFNYIGCFVLLFAGLYLIITTGNLVKKLFGLAIFQAAALVFFISVGRVSDGRAPILEKGAEEASMALVYVNPLPQVLVLTAIVVGLAVLSVGLALVIQIKKSYGSIEQEDLEDSDK